MSSPVRTHTTKKSGPSTVGDVTGTDVAGDKRALDVQVAGGSVSGTFTPRGLTTDFRITTMDVTDTAAALPTTALTGRNAIAIHNLDGAETLYIGKMTVTADQALGTTAGWEVGPGEAFNLDVTDSISLFGRAPTGKTIRVKILEVA